MILEWFYFYLPIYTCLSPSNGSHFLLPDSPASTVQHCTVDQVVQVKPVSIEPHFLDCGLAILFCHTIQGQYSVGLGLPPLHEAKCG